MKHAIFRVYIVVVFMVLPTGLQAPPFTVSWDGTISGVDEAGSTGVSVGDPFTFTLTLDNGGSTALSQTWDGGDFVSAGISVNAGAFVDTSFDLVGGMYSASGVFATNALGELTSKGTWWHATLPPEANGKLWTSYGESQLFASWSPDTVLPSNVSYSYYFSSASTYSSPVSDWNHSWATIPEPSSLALVGLGTIALLGYRRCERRSDEKSKEAT